MTTVSMFVFGVISIEVWKTQMPLWAFVLALVIGTSVRDGL
jgi:TctA family transporter